MNPRIFAKLIPRFKGASGAGRLLLNTKASQEAACSRAPDAIVPDQEPESHDAGVSRFGENGSHTQQRRMPQRAMRDRWTVQVAAEMPEQAHTRQRWMPQRAMRGRLAA